MKNTFRRDSPETELILLDSRTVLNDLYLEKIQALLKLDIDWAYLFQTARNHGVLSLVARNLSMNCSELIPSSELSQLESFLQQNSLNNLLLIGELTKTLELLNKSQITAIPFKGIVLAFVAYNDLSLRQISDLDILVRDEDFERARDLLLEQGFVTKVDVPWECHLINDRGTNIDLHCAIAPEHIIYPLPNAQIWQNIEKTSFGSLEINTFTPEFLLIILSINGAKENWQSLSRICDVAQLLHNNPNLDWSKLFEFTNTWGLFRLVLVACSLANRLLSVELSKVVLDRIESNRKICSIVKEIENNLFSDMLKSRNEVESTLFCLQLRERWQDKLGCLFHIANHSGWNIPTKSDREYFDLPKNFFWLYYLIRPLRVIKKYWIGNKK